MRASSISMMTSTWGMTSAISLRALCMWPGNQLMDISVTLSLACGPLGAAGARGCGCVVMRQTAGTHRKDNRGAFYLLRPRFDRLFWPGVVTGWRGCPPRHREVSGRTQST